jgi:TonB-linked SusC/RagA family outer membrane protein
MKVYTFFIMFMLSARILFAQQGTVTGVVTGQDDQQPIPGATIKVNNSTNGTITDANGKFSIKAKPADVLHISFVGYVTQNITVGKQSNIVVTLSTSATKLTEVVVVGYGTQKKANLTGSVASINLEDVQGVPIANFATALQGRLPGVTISAFNNQPGKNDPQILIRGIGTLGSTSPLIVIDGVPAETGDLGLLNADDIESVSVLKDAASASIYGVRAANGVILVTTKRGKSGKAKIQFREVLTIEKPLIKPDYMDAITWANSYNDYLTETGSAPVFTPAMLQKISDQSDPDNFGNTDWFAAVYKPALFQNTYISASGGSDASRYLVSAGYQNQNGLMAHTGSSKVQLRANYDNKISNALSFGLNLSGYRQTIKEPIAAADGNDSGDNGINREISGFTRPTVVPIYSFGAYGTSDASGLVIIKNPVQQLDNQIYNTTNYGLNGKIFGELKIVKDLSFTSSFAFNYSNSQVVRFSPSLASYASDGTLLSAPQSSSLYNSSVLVTSYINENLLHYNKKFGKHDLKFLVGQTVQHQENSNMAASVFGLPSNSIQVLSGSSSTPTVSGTKSALSLQSFLGRVNYTYNNKYLFEANARIDGTSRLPNSEQYPIFPSVSVGWIISEEPFLKNNSSISLLKLRASYGILGNQEIGNYSFTQVYSTSQNYVFNNALVQGVAITSLANANIKWETTAMTDVGADIELFGGKLGFVMDYFNKNASDILYKSPIPNTLGALSAPYQNVAKVNNKGFELTVTHKNNIGKFRYNLAFNGSVIRNNVVSLNGDVNVISGANILTPGQPINSYYGYISDGIIRTQDDLNSAPTGIGSLPLRIGDLRFRDLDGDGKITANDKTVIGNTFPKFSYGFNMAGTYKGFDISAFFQGVAGLNRYISDQVAMGPRGQKLNIWTQRWTVNNPDGILPRYGNPNNNGVFSTFGADGQYGFLDGSYLRLKNIEIGYTIPKTITSRIGVSNLRIYFSGVNLLTLTKVKNYDVEKAQDDTRSIGYLDTKNYALGLSLNL